MTVAVEGDVAAASAIVLSIAVAVAAAAVTAAKGTGLSEITMAAVEKTVVVNLTIAGGRKVTAAVILQATVIEAAHLSSLPGHSQRGMANPTAASTSSASSCPAIAPSGPLCPSLSLKKRCTFWIPTGLVSKTGFIFTLEFNTST